MSSIPANEAKHAAFLHRLMTSALSAKLAAFQNLSRSHVCIPFLDPKTSHHTPAPLTYEPKKKATNKGSKIDPKSILKLLVIHLGSFLAHGGIVFGTILGSKVYSQTSSNFEGFLEDFIDRIWLRFGFQFGTHFVPPQGEGGGGNIEAPQCWLSSFLGGNVWRGPGRFGAHLGSMLCRPIPILGSFRQHVGLILVVS